MQDNKGQHSSGEVRESPLWLKTHVVLLVNNGKLLQTVVQGGTYNILAYRKACK